LSAHADRDGLLKWINSFDKKPDRVFVTHGEDSVSDKFAEYLNELGFSAVAPLYKSVYDLRNGELITPGIEIERELPGVKEPGAVSSSYRKLIDAASRLVQIVSHKKNTKNEEIEKFAGEIIRLAKKWDKKN